MFNNCPLLALIETKKKTFIVKRICEDHDSQVAIDKTFSDAAEALKKDKTDVVFDGKYTPQSEDMEILVIQNYALPTVIKEALKNPQGLEVYSPVDGALPSIKALFVGEYACKDDQEQYTAAFQKFRNDQYITAARHHLFFTGDTFVKDSRVGITIGTAVDCVIEDGNLYFPSYHYAKQIFDLTDYYRVASSQDVQAFVDSDLITMESSTTFVDAADTWERRKIASINASGILQNHTAKQIKSLAQKSGVSISVSDGHIVLPTDKKERHIVLGFLDEEVYKGAFSETVFQTNSKRKAR